MKSTWIDSRQVKLRKRNRDVRDLGGITNNMELTMSSPTTVTTGLVLTTVNFKSFQKGKVCLVREDRELNLIVRGVTLGHITFVPYNEPEMQVTVYADRVTDTYQEAMLTAFLTGFTTLASRLAKKELDLKAMFDYEPDED